MSGGSGACRGGQFGVGYLGVACCLGLVLGSYLTLYFTSGRTTNHIWISPLSLPSSESTPSISVIPAITTAMQHIAKAHRYARSGKTMWELGQAMEALNALSPLSVPQDQGLDSATTQHSGSPKSVCPEIWTGMESDWPYYLSTHKTTSCDYGRRLGEVVTVLMDLRGGGGTVDQARATLQATQVAQGGIGVWALIRDDWMAPLQEFITKNNYTNNIHLSFTHDSIVEMLSKQYSGLWTKYLLIVQDSLIRWDSFAEVGRLVRMLEGVGDAGVVGGSHRNQTGHWKIGCYQTALKAYQYRLQEGYDLSQNACVFCDYLDAPFLIKKELLAEFLGTSFEGELWYVNLFESLKKRGHRVLSCPDAMFYTASIGRLDHVTRSDWLKFAQVWEIDMITLGNGSVLEFECRQSKPKSCEVGAGLVVRRCCIAELRRAVVDFMVACQLHNLSCELNCGTTIGAVKMYDILPWERDADIHVKASDFARIRELKSVMKAKGYELIESENPEKCLDKPIKTEGWKKGDPYHCGYWSLKTQHWHVDLYGLNEPPTSLLLQAGVQWGTKVLVGGAWVAGPPSPAAFVRNKYGGDTFKHVEHYNTLGMSGWAGYQGTFTFSKCPRPGFHGCLTQYLPVGNLQFQDPIWI